jgi:hypothetical protein
MKQVRYVIISNCLLLHNKLFMYAYTMHLFNKLS